MSVKYQWIKLWKPSRYGREYCRSNLYWPYMKKHFLKSFLILDIMKENWVNITCHWEQEWVFSFLTCLINGLSVFPIGYYLKVISLFSYLQFSDFTYKACFWILVYWHAQLKLIWWDDQVAYIVWFESRKCAFNR